MKKDILNLETRRKIYNYIMQHPGVHFRQLSKKLQIRGSTLEYHLRILTKQSLISTMKENGYSRFFVKRAIGKKEKKVLGLLRQKTTRYIIIAILNCCGLSSKELCKLLNKSPSTIDFHIKRLLKYDIIEICPAGKERVKKSSSYVFVERNIIGREIVYQLKEPYWVEKLVIMYKDSLLDGISKDVFESIRDWHNGDIQKLIRLDKATDRLLEKLFDIFPPPYHI